MRTIQTFGIAGILGALIALAYNYEFGASEWIVLLFFASLMVWAVAACFAIIFARRYKRMLLDKFPQEKQTEIRAKKVMWLGLLLCILPLPWLYVMSNIFGGPLRLSPASAFGFPILFWLVGVGLLVYREFVRWRVFVRIYKTRSGVQ